MKIVIMREDIEHELSTEIINTRDTGDITGLL